jgi:hypothetical protein
VGAHPVFHQPQKTWFQRHLGLTIAGGCAVLLAAALTFTLILFTFIFGMMRNSDAVKMALRQAQSNPIVAERLGTPLETGWFMSGNINVSGPSGHAEMEIPVSGSKGKGTIYLVADKNAGLWSFSTLQVAFADGEPRIDLLQLATPQVQ